MEEKEFNYINVIPLVDIMLVLLAIVLVTATFIVQGNLSIKLPYSKTAKINNIKSYQIVITKEGDLYFEKKRVTLNELDKIVQSLGSEAQISILADKDTRVQLLIEVLDVLKKHKLKKVFIRTELLE